MTVQASDLVFCYDFDTLMSDGRLRDFGPYGLHASFPGGAANPTRLLDGGYSFDGGDYLSLSGDSQSRFYTVAPTGAHTWISVHSLAYSVGGSVRVFSAEDLTAGNYKGISLIPVVSSNPGFTRITQLKGTAVFEYNTVSAADFLLDSYSVSIVVVGPSLSYMTNATIRTGSWAAGGFGTAVYNTAMVPKFYSTAAGAGGTIGKQRYASLIGRAISTDEMLYLSRELRDGRKPFCWRSP